MLELFWKRSLSHNGRKVSRFLSNFPPQNSNNPFDRQRTQKIRNLPIFVLLGFCLYFFRVGRSSKRKTSLIVDYDCYVIFLVDVIVKVLQQQDDVYLTE